MSPEPIQLATIFTIIIGTYFIATIMFNWGCSSYLRCHFFAFDQNPLSSAPFVLTTMLIWFGLSFIEVHVVSVISLEATAAIELFFYLILWPVFFRAMSNFKKLSVLSLALLSVGAVLLVSIEYLVIARAQQENNPVVLLSPAMTSYIRDQGELFGKLAVTKAGVIDSLYAQLSTEDRARSVREKKADVQVWGKGSEMATIAVADWLTKSQNEIGQFIEWLDVTRTNLLITMLSTVSITWIVPMSLVLGKVVGFVRLKTADVIVVNDSKRALLISQNAEWIVVAEDTLRGSSREYIRLKSDTRIVVIPSSIFLRQLLLCVASAVFRGASELMVGPEVSPLCACRADFGPKSHLGTSQELK